MGAVVVALVVAVVIVVRVVDVLEVVVSLDEMPSNHHKSEETWTVKYLPEMDLWLLLSFEARLLMFHAILNRVENK